MSVLSDDYTGCHIYIYDLEGEILVETKVSSHDKITKQIQVKTMPPGLKVNDECKLFILTSPAPCEYQGKIKKLGGMFSIAMFQGQVKENRAATRYKVNTPAKLTSYFYSGRHYELFKPIDVTLINISTTGVRFRAPFYTMNEGDMFRIKMVVSGSEKNLIAQVMNHLDNGAQFTDYGCHFQT